MSLSLKARVAIYLEADGHKRVAMGQSLYHWHFVLRLPDADPAYGAPPKHGTFLGDLIVDIPAPEAVIATALARLADQAKDIQQRATTELMELEDEKQNLLSLTYSAPITPPTTVATPTAAATDEIEDAFPF